jgi:hypothetical protein
VTSAINRYYDPTTDEFLSVDPEVSTTSQPYVYTNDDPLNATDSLGDDPMGRTSQWFKDDDLPAWLRGASNTRLQTLINREYRGSPYGGKRIGDGSSTDFVMNEATDGGWDGNLDDLSHYQKLNDQIRSLDNLESTEDFDSSDQSIVQGLRDKFQSARSDIIKISSGNYETELAGAIDADQSVASDAARAGNMTELDALIGEIIELDEGEA